MTLALISLDTHWQDASQLSLPAAIAPWVMEAASLTARLKRHCRQFRLQVLQEQATLLPGFLQPLLPGCSRAQLREVVLWCDEQPCVYAQSWLPQHTIATLLPLADLGERPLGDYIFQQPGLKRGKIEASEIDIALQLLPGVAAGRCFTRRSVFMLDGLPLLVAEAFLPAITQLKAVKI